MITFMVLLPALLFAQIGLGGFFNSISPYVEVSMIDDTTHTVYVLFPDGDGNWYVSETLPNPYLWVSGATYRLRSTVSWMSGDCDMIVQVDTVATVNNNQNTDSLTFQITPLVYDQKDFEFAEILSDTTYIKFGANDSYSSATRVYLDWTHGVEYHSLLTSELWPVAGFVLKFNHVTEDTTDSATVRIWNYMSRQNR